MLCHYPEHKETAERAKKTSEVQKLLDLPVWIFGSASARYPEPVEAMTAKILLALGVPKDKVIRSSEMDAEVSLDTVQEMFNVVKLAKERGVERIICVSNPLQLMQVHGLLRKEGLDLIYCPSTLKDWRWWYVTMRIALIPIAFMGVGKEFPPLKLVRHARAKWPRWPL